MSSHQFQSGGRGRGRGRGRGGGHTVAAIDPTIPSPRTSLDLGICPAGVVDKSLPPVNLALDNVTSLSRYSVPPNRLIDIVAGGIQDRVGYSETDK